MFAFLLAAGVSPVSAGAPANDDFPGIVIDSLPFSDSRSTQGATREPDEPASACDLTFGFEDSPTVWYTYTSPDDAVLIATTQGSNFDVISSVWTASTFPGGGLAEIGCTDTFLGETTLSFEVKASESYYFQLIGDVFGNPSGNLVFHLEAGVPAVNDTFGDETVISASFRRLRAYHRKHHRR